MFSNLFGDGRIGGILALVIGLCLLGLIAIYLWRAFGRGIRAAAPRGARQPRLGIVDAFDLDRHRQLVLVRRDNVEHLIMIGGPNDLLIEEAIVRAQPSGAERREPASAPNNQQERQPPRVPIEPAQGGQGASTAPSLDIKPGQQEPAAAAPVAPPLRPTLDPTQGDAPVAPPAPLNRPPLTATSPRPMPPRPAPPVRPAPAAPAPTSMPAPPRPGAPTIAQRPVTAPSVTPPAPPVAAPEAERAPQPAREPAKEPPKLSVNIDSLEEEMAKLLGRPTEPPKN